MFLKGLQHKKAFFHSAKSPLNIFWHNTWKWLNNPNNLFNQKTKIMKAIKLVLLGILFFTSSMNAQVSINVNIGTPPAWGPTGYTDIRYYYLPDIEMYYDINTAMFIYFSNGGWVRTAYLPRPYRHYDLYSAYKVCLHDYGPNPYVYYKRHKVKYYRGYRGTPQVAINPRPRDVEYRVINDSRRDYEYRDDRRDNNYRERKHNDFRTEYRTADNGNSRNDGKSFDNGNGRGNGRDYNSGDRGNNGNGREYGGGDRGGDRGNGHGRR